MYIMTWICFDGDSHDFALPPFGFDIIQCDTG